MKTFERYEIHPIATFTDVLGFRSCEPVPDEDAQFWSLYGQVSGEEVEWIGDFPTRQLAEDVLTHITLAAAA